MPRKTRVPSSTRKLVVRPGMNRECLRSARDDQAKITFVAMRRGRGARDLSRLGARRRAVAGERIFAAAEPRDVGRCNCFTTGVSASGALFSFRADLQS